MIDAIGLLLSALLQTITEVIIWGCSKLARLISRVFRGSSKRNQEK